MAKAAVLKELNDFFIPPSNGGASFRQLAEELVVRIMTERYVDLVTPLSGFYPGLWPNINGKRVLVTDNGIRLPWLNHKMSDAGVPADRGKVRHFIQQMASDTRHAYEGKSKDERDLPAFHVVSVSCNKNHKDMQIIPPLDTLEGKYLLIQCFDYQKWMPSKLFLDLITAELGAFLYELREWPIPEEMLTKDRSGRYTIRGYADPELARMVAQLDPADKLLALLHDAYGEGIAQLDKKLKASEIYKLIFDQPHLKGELLKLAETSSQKLAYLLIDLADRGDGNIIRHRPSRGFEKYELGPTFKAQHDED
jgi:hypothetical protein